MSPPPPINSQVSPSEVRELSIEVEGHEAGGVEQRAQVPEGWRLMNLRRDRY